MGLQVVLGCRLGSRFGGRRRFLGNFSLPAEYGGINLSRNLVDFGDDAAQILTLIKKACSGGLPADIHHFGIQTDAVSQYRNAAEQGVIRI